MNDIYINPMTAMNRLIGPVSKLYQARKRLLKYKQKDLANKLLRLQALKKLSNIKKLVREIGSKDSFY
jgi:hypothetical protein